MEEESGSTEKQILEGVDGNNRIKKDALRRLLKNNRIIRSGEGGAKDPFKYFYEPVPEDKEEEF